MVGIVFLLLGPVRGASATEWVRALDGGPGTDAYGIEVLETQWPHDFAWALGTLSDGQTGPWIMEVWSIGSILQSHRYTVTWPSHAVDGDYAWDAGIGILSSLGDVGAEEGFWVRTTEVHPALGAPFDFQVRDPVVAVPRAMGWQGYGGPLVVGVTDSVAPGRRRAWIFGMDSDGTVRQQMVSQGPGDDELSRIFMLESYDPVLVGTTTSVGAGREDVWVIMMDSTDQILWQKAYGGSGADRPIDVYAAPADGGVVILAETDSFGAEGVDLWLFHVDRQGTLLHEERFGGPGDEHGGTLSLGGQGGSTRATATTDSFGQGVEPFLFQIHHVNGTSDAVDVMEAPSLEELRDLKPLYSGNETLSIGTTRSFDDLTPHLLLTRFESVPTATECPGSRREFLTPVPTVATVTDADIAFADLALTPELASSQDEPIDPTIALACVNCVPDAFEDDEPCDSTNPIIDGGDLQRHDFCEDTSDWVRFQGCAGESYAIETANLGPVVDTTLELFAPDCVTPLDSDDNGNGGFASRIEWIAPADGVYHVAAHQIPGVMGENRGYDLLLTGDTTSCLPTCSDDAFEEDDACDPTVSLLEGGDNQSHEHCTDPNDWVRFQGCEGQPYTIETANLGAASDTFLTLNDQACGAVLATDDNGAGGLASRIDWSAPADGVYYVEVTQTDGGSGDDRTYDLLLQGDTTSCLPPACSDDTYEEDDACDPGVAAIEGGETQIRRHCLDGSDWVRFQGCEGTSYRIETANLGPQSDTVLNLLGTGCGGILASDDNGAGGLASLIDWTAPADGVYYLEVSQTDGGSGDERDYDLILQGDTTSCLPPPCTDDAYEEDDLCMPGLPAIEGGETQSREHCDDALDVVLFQGCAGESYVISTSNLGAESDTVLDLYAPDCGALLASDDNGGGGLASRIDWTAPADGVYSLGVTQRDASSGPDRTYDLNMVGDTTSCLIPDPPGEVSEPGRAAQLLVFTDHETLRWEEGAPTGSDAFHLYRGRLTDLPSGDYGSCLESDIPTNTTTDTETPPSGTGWFYLVTGVNAAGEGIKGHDSGGTLRDNASPCI